MKLLRISIIVTMIFFLCAIGVGKAKGTTQVDLTDEEKALDKDALNKIKNQKGPVPKTTIIKVIYLDPQPAKAEPPPPKKTPPPDPPKQCPKCKVDPVK